MPASLYVDHKILKLRSNLKPLSDRVFNMFATFSGFINGTDYIVISDGAGLQLRDQGGYAALVYECETSLYSLVAGNCTTATVNQMELTGVIAGLKQIYQIFGAREANVKAFTDSTYVANMASRPFERSTPNADLLAQLQWWQNQFTVLVLHINRESIGIVDRVSKWASSDAKDLKQFLNTEKFESMPERSWRKKLRDIIVD